MNLFGLVRKQVVLTAGALIFMDLVFGNCVLSCRAESAAATTVTPKPPGLLLNGRLEQISGRQAQLPIYKTISGLKTRAGKLDASVAQTQPAPAPLVQNYSFPRTFDGNWGGRLAITSCRYGNDIPEDRHQLSIGDEGLGIFSFSNNHGKMLLEPARLWFKPQIARKIKNFGVPEGMQNQTQDPEAKVAVALLDLGGVDSVDNAGQHVTYSTLKNTLVPLRRNVLEQNIVLRSNRRNEKTGAQRQDYTETIVRITTIRPDLMYAQIGLVQYNPAGEALAQYVCQGWITRNWLAAAKGIENMTGLTLGELGYNSDLSARAAAASLPPASDFQVRTGGTPALPGRPRR
jgi:hypothetical protein